VRNPGVSAVHFIFGTPVQIDSVGALSCLYRQYQGSLPGGQVAGPGLGRGVDHPSTSNAEVKEGVELYLCSPSVPA